jgi:hypothetical protein
MIYTSFNTYMQFLEKQEKAKRFYTEQKLAADADTRARDADWKIDCCMALVSHPRNPSQGQ